MNDPEPLPPPRLSIEQRLTAITMALIALITLANVIVRYLTAYSFAFTEDVSVSTVWLSRRYGFGRQQAALAATGEEGGLASRPSI
ncbi:MAG: hypothetical protein IPK63_20115 [Candidatus Competibacteraceae bacterium]|nr:hypothetical protein [Candidatus Competibacteraceae bacterium]